MKTNRIALLLALLSLPAWGSATRTIDADALTSSDHTKTWTPPAATDTLLGRASTDTLTNKSVDYNTNTLTNLPASAAQQLLLNPGFENGTSQTGWTADTVSKANETTNIIEGARSVALTYSSQSGGIHQDVTPTIQTNGISMVASCRVKTTLTDIQVCGRSGATNFGCTTVSSNGSWVIQPINFSGPTNGTSVGVAVASVGSDTGTVYVDDCYVGPAAVPQNIGQVAQAQFIGSAFIPQTSSCTFARTNTALGSFGTNGSCPGPTVEFNPGPGTIQTTNTNLPKFTVNSLPPGSYEVKVQVSDFGSTTFGGQLAINDGTTTSGTTQFSASIGSLSHVIVGYFTYSTASNHTFEIFGAASTGTLSVDVNSTGTKTQFSIVRYPTSAEIAFRPDVLPGNYSGTLAGVGGGWSTTSTSYADPSVATTSSTLTTVGTSRNITCAAESTKLPGITCTLPRQGNYFVCASPTLFNNTAGSDVVARLVDGSTTIINGGMAASTGSTNQDMPVTLCGTYNAAASNSSITFKIQLAVPGGSATGKIDQITTAPITWSVVGVDSGLPAPILVGSVTSNSTGQEHMERASVTTSCTSSPCTIASQSGSWLTSIARTATGRYVANFTSGEFSAAPTCIGNGGNAGSGADNFRTETAPTTSSWAFRTFNTSDAALNDDDFYIVCMGPR